MSDESDMAFTSVQLQYDTLKERCAAYEAMLILARNALNAVTDELRNSVAYQQSLYEALHEGRSALLFGDSNEPPKAIDFCSIDRRDYDAFRKLESLIDEHGI